MKITLKDLLSELTEEDMMELTFQLDSFKRRIKVRGDIIQKEIERAAERAAARGKKLTEVKLPPIDRFALSGVYNFTGTFAVQDGCVKISMADDCGSHDGEILYLKQYVEE